MSFIQVLHIITSAESRCESGRLLAHESQKMVFLFDKKKYFNECVATHFLPRSRLYKVPICRFIVATQMSCTSFSVTVPTYRNKGNVKKHVFSKSCITSWALIPASHFLMKGVPFFQVICFLTIFMLEINTIDSSPLSLVALKK